MAISVVSSADLGNVTGFVFSQPFTCSGGATNRIVVAIIGDFTAIDGGGGHDDITNVGYGGVAMTLAVKNIINVHQAPRYSYLYFLDNPASGSNAVAVTTANSHLIAVCAAELTGVGQTGTVDATAISNSGSVATTLTTAITTVADDCLAVLVESGYSGNGAPTAGTGSNLLVAGVTFGIPGVFDSSSLISPAGSFSMTTNRASSVVIISHAIASMAPPPTTTALTVDTPSWAEWVTAPNPRDIGISAEALGTQHRDD